MRFSEGMEVVDVVQGIKGKITEVRNASTKTKGWIKVSQEMAFECMALEVVYSRRSAQKFLREVKAKAR